MTCLSSSVLGTIRCTHTSASVHPHRMGRDSSTGRSSVPSECRWYVLANHELWLWGPSSQSSAQSEAMHSAARMRIQDEGVGIQAQDPSFRAPSVITVSLTYTCYLLHLKH